MSVVGAWTNLTMIINSAYSVQNSDATKTLRLSGGNFYSVFFGDPATYNSGFIVVLINTDVGRAKWIAFNNNPPMNFYLWPDQTVMIFVQSNTWQIIGKSRWKLPGGQTTIYFDPNNGSDVPGQSDGLSSGAGAFRSSMHALYLISDQFDYTSSSDVAGISRIVLLNAPGAVDTIQIHYSPHGGAAPGATGGAAITLDLNGGALDPTGGSGSGSCLQLYFGAVLQLRNGVIRNTAGIGNGIDVAWGSKIYILDGVHFGRCNNSGFAHISVSGGGHLQFINDYGIDDSATYHIVNSGGFIDTPLPINAFIFNNLSVSNMVFGGGSGSNTDLSRINRILGGFSVTATNRYAIGQNAVLFGSSLIPGSGPGITSTGGQAV